MRTHFSEQQLENPHLFEAESILRKCVHCGMCTATCPTFKLLGDELDSPRGRIYQIQNMLENDRPATSQEMTHIDRCLTCLSCMTTCPSGVHYGHLSDIARAHIQKKNKRPLFESLLRYFLARTLPYPSRTVRALRMTRITKYFVPLFKKSQIYPQLKAAMDLLPASQLVESDIHVPRTCKANFKSKGGVILMRGCVQSVIAPEINEAAVSFLTKMGIDVTITKDNCCGSLHQHMGREKTASKLARHNIDLWYPLIKRGKLGAIITTTSGCGTLLKDYGHMFKDDPKYKNKAALVAQYIMDISQYIATLDLPEAKAMELEPIAYHPACSLQHGQQITIEPLDLLKKAGFTVKEIPEKHICCGSAGIYNILQPDIAQDLKARKIGHIKTLKTNIVATANIGCMTQLSRNTGLTVIHLIELLAWSYCGRRPSSLIEDNQA